MDVCQYCIENGSVFTLGSVSLWSGVYVTEDSLEISLNYEYNGLEEWRIHINYCPFCGRELS